MNGSAGLNPQKNKKLGSAGLKLGVQNLLPEYEDLAVGPVVLIVDNIHKDKVIIFERLHAS